MININTLVANPLALSQRVLKLWLWITILIIYSIFSILYFHIPINPDDAVFTYIGWVMSEGGTIYTDAADQNWPGQMLIHWLAVLVFGEYLWAYRALEVFFILPLSTCFLYRFTQAIYQPYAAMLVVLLFPCLYMLAGFWTSGQRDLLAGVLFIPTCWMLQQRILGAAWSRLIFQGLLIILATLIRPTMLIIAPLLFVVDILLMVQHKRSLKTIFFDHCVVGLTIVCCSTLVIAYGWLNGALSVWYEVSILFATQVYSQSVGVTESLIRGTPHLLVSWRFYIPLMLVGAVLLFNKNRVGLFLLLAIIPATLISFLVQGKALNYHLAPLYASFSVLMSVALGFSVNTLSQQQVPLLRYLLSLLLVSLTVLGLAKMSAIRFAHPFQFLTGQVERLEYLGHYQAGVSEVLTIADAYQIAQYIDETTPADARVLFWARPTHINIIARRPSPLREASIALLLEPTKRFTAYTSWYERIDTMFKQRPPEVLLLIKDKNTGHYVGFGEPNLEKGFSALVTQNLPRYQKERDFGNTELYRLKD